TPLRRADPRRNLRRRRNRSERQGVNTETGKPLRRSPASFGVHALACPLVAKEVRLLLPAFATALLLAFVPLWFMPAGLAVVLFGLGTVLLALSPFGREFGLKTFPLILAQPLERRRIWRIKIGLLTLAMAAVFFAWCAA